MDTDERLSALERKLEEYDRLIAKLVTYARLTAGGRMLLKVLGL